MAFLKLADFLLRWSVRTDEMHFGNLNCALKASRLVHLPIYNLRATSGSRLSASGTPDLFVAQMMGHSGTSILHVYAKAIDESRREAIKKFEAYRQSHLKDVGSVAPASPDSHLPDKQPAARAAFSKKPFLN